jgi:hypothetical protein
VATLRVGDLLDDQQPPSFVDCVSNMTHDHTGFVVTPIVEDCHQDVSITRARRALEEVAPWTSGLRAKAHQFAFAFMNGPPTG